VIQKKVVDSSDTRLDKQHRIALYVSMFAEGVSKPELVAFAMEKGNVARTATTHITDLEIIKVLKLVNGTYYCDRTRFEEWAFDNSFVERAVKVRCLHCGNLYDSDSSMCPRCESVERALFKDEQRKTLETSLEKEVSEPYTYTHIHTHTPARPEFDQIEKTAKEALEQPIFTQNHQQDNEPGPNPFTHRGKLEAGEGPYTYTHMQTNESELLLENTPRRLRDTAGREAEQRVCKVLDPYYQVEVGLGTNGEPDLWASGKNGHFVIEVKSMQARSSGRANDVTLSKDAWRAFSETADSCGYVRRLIVEVRVPQADYPFTYYIIPGEMVDFKATKHKGDWISLSVHILPGFASEIYTPGIPKGRRLWL